MKAYEFVFVFVQRFRLAVGTGDALLLAAVVVVGRVPRLDFREGEFVNVSQLRGMVCTRAFRAHYAVFASR